MVLDAHLHVHAHWPSLFGCFVCLCAHGMLRLAEFFLQRLVLRACRFFFHFLVRVPCPYFDLVKFSKN